MTQKKLEQLVRKWQRILRLRDWDIEIISVDHDGFTREGSCIAEIELSSNQKEAIMKVIKPDHYSIWNNKKYDVEESVIHELLHIYLGGIEKYARGEEETALHIATENAANLISEALVKLDRRND